MMNPLRLLLPFAFLATSVLAADTYDIRLARPVKAGARFKIAARVAFQSETTTKLSDFPEMNEKVNVACKLSGELTVLAVTGKGMPKELQLKINEVEGYDDGEKAEIFKAGDLVNMKHGDEKDVITVNGEDADENGAELLDALLNVAAEDEATDDDAFGNPRKVELGAEWPANREVLATEMKRQNLLGLNPDDFKATTRLAETTTVNEQPAVRVICEMKFSSPKAKLPNLGENMKSTGVKAEVRSEMDLPIDVNSLSLHARARLDFEIKAEGTTEDEEGQPVSTRITIKRRAAVDATETPLP